MPLSGDHVVGDPNFVPWANLVDTTIGAAQAAITAETTRATAAEGTRQPLDADLTAIAALDSATAGALATDGAGWVRKTYAQLKTALGLVKADVGLGNVDNTADASKPVSTAQAAADTAVQAAAVQRANHTGTQLAATVSDFSSAALAATTGAYQPVDSDLTAIAALTTTAYGRALLALADAAALRTAAGLGTAATAASTDFQPVDSDLTAIAALTTTAFGRSFLDRADAAASRTLLGLGTAATTPAMLPTATKTAAYTAVDGDLVLADATAGAFTVTLPASTAGRRIAVRKFDSSANAVTVATTSGTIDGTATRTLSKQWQTQVYVADGTNWQRLDVPGVSGIAASGTADATTFLRGDGSWATPAGGGSFSTPLNMLPSGRYQALGWGGSIITGGAAAAYTEVTYIPVVVDRAVTVTALAIEVTTSGVASAPRIGIYNDSNGLPGSRVLDAGAVDGSTTGVKEITVSQALATGRYWIAVYWGGVSIQLRLTQNGATYGSGTTAAAVAGAASSSGYYTSATGLADPAPAPTGGWDKTPRVIVKVS